MGKFRNEIGVHPEQRATYVGSGHFIYAPTTIFAGLVGDSITSVTLDVSSLFRVVCAVKVSGSILSCATITSVYLNQRIGTIHPLLYLSL